VSNARQVKEIEERVLALSGILRSPPREGDHSENARRELLRRSVCLRVPTFTAILLTQGIFRRLVDVIVNLEPLSEQSGLSKFLRNEDYAGLLNGFVQDLAHAVTDYQVCSRKRTVQGH
jgi:hypothetical protein